MNATIEPLSREELRELYPEGKQLSDEHYAYQMRGIPREIREVMYAQIEWLREINLHGYSAPIEYRTLEEFKEHQLNDLNEKRQRLIAEKLKRRQLEQKRTESLRKAEEERNRRGHWRALPLDIPLRVTEDPEKRSKSICRGCSRPIAPHEETIPPRASECTDCTRRVFEALTSHKIPGDSKRSDTWKVDNLHLYLEQISRELAESSDRVLVVRPFTIREFVEPYDNRCHARDCNRLWTGLSYRLSPADGGSHSLENVRPACEEHAL